MKEIILKGCDSTDIYLKVDPFVQGIQGPVGPPGPEPLNFQSNFLSTDWTGPSAGFYLLTFQHNLNHLIVDVQVWDDGNNPVVVDRTIDDANSVTLQIPCIPDLRFSGFIWINTV